MHKLFRRLFPTWIVGYIDSSTGFAIMRTRYTERSARNCRLMRQHGEELGLIVMQHS